MLNKCANCGKFRSWNFLKPVFNVDFSGKEDLYYICTTCKEKEDLEDIKHKDFFSLLRNTSKTRT